MARKGVGGDFLSHLIQRDTKPFDIVYAEIGIQDAAIDPPLRITNAGKFIVLNYGDSVIVNNNLDANIDGTYIPQGALLNISNIEEDADFNIGEVTLTLSGVNGAAITQLLGSPYLDRRVKVWRGFLDGDGGVIDFPVLIFDGNIRGASITDDPAEGKSVVNVNVSSQWSDFERRNGNKTNDAEQQSRFPGDRGLEFAADTIRNIEWGRS